LIKGAKAMIQLYTGTPGSGKSLHVARKMMQMMRMHKMNVITNRPINMDVVTKNGKLKVGRYDYLKNTELTVDYLVNYAMEHHAEGKEGQTLIVIDEAGITFNSRDFGKSDRPAWLDFFRTHRHYGFNVIMITQVDRMIDRQIRALVEYETRHRKANNFKFIGFLFTLFRIGIFVGVEKWYGINEKLGAEWFFFRKRDAQLYDTFMLFSKEHYGKRIGDVMKQRKVQNNAPVSSRSTEPPARTGKAPAIAGRGPARTERAKAANRSLRYICYTQECDSCTHEKLCKMTWKYTPLEQRT
jgi:hypothetical protein